MGENTNKTYTAPDGSVFRIDADGSVTKIKNGQSQTQPHHQVDPKYHVTPDGKIFIENPDGTRKFVGYAEKPPTTANRSSNVPPVPTNKSNTTMWILVLLILVLGSIIVYGIVTHENSNPYQDSSGTQIEEPYQQQTEEWALVDSTKADAAIYYPEESYKTDEDVTAIDQKQQFMNDGYFYGTLGDEPISGQILFDSEYPYGYFRYYNYYTDEPYWFYCQSSDNSVWHVFYDDEHIGSFYFDNWDLYNQNFGWGNYDSVGGDFSLDLYQTNY